ncbi:hypothetical protein PHMEG_00032944 [Phytophthora megakarya]|uniref:Uncharacterized protein n=1 Tax=Phytophthora megakarya TaxID=4795 RepID=A0A225UWV1_9STRA|nr:hypothetical protein PHMEG_00032944 [Phytophthora megakarya]
MFCRPQNLCEIVLPPYNTIPERWMRGCPLNAIAVGHVWAGDVTHHIIRRSDRVKTLQEDDKYSKARTIMEHIVTVLSVQSIPTLRAAMGFLDGFARALHEGNFADFAVGFTPDELDVIKLESKPAANLSSVGEATPSNSKSSYKKYGRQKAPQSALQSHVVSSECICAEGEEKAGNSFRFPPPPKSSGLTRKQERQIIRANKIRTARLEAKKLAEKENFGNIRGH